MNQFLLISFSVCFLSAIAAPQRPGYSLPRPESAFSPSAPRGDPSGGPSLGSPSGASSLGSPSAPSLGSPRAPSAQATPLTPPIPILVDERVIDNGNYGYRVQTGNGISLNENGTLVQSAVPGALPHMQVSGSYSFTHPDGTPHTMTYVAGPQGFVPQSSLIPTPHPIPAFVMEQILFAEQQKRSAAESGIKPKAPSRTYSV